MKQVVIRRPGGFEALELTERELPYPRPGEVRVAVRSFCLNFNDIDIIKGRYTTLPLQPPFVPGMETVGIVEAAGPGSEYLVGRRIVVLRILLGHDENVLVVAHDLFESLHGLLAADEERHDHAGEDHDVSQGKDRVDPVAIEFGA